MSVAPLTPWARLGQLVRWWRGQIPEAHGTVDVEASPLVYRLRSWPELHDEARVAEVYRLLSVMSHRPVNRRWLISISQLQPEQVDQLLEELTAAGVLEVIDTSDFAPLAAQRQAA